MKTAQSMKEPCQRWTSLLNFGDVSRKDDHTPNMLWMEEMREELKEKIISMKEFGITKNGEKV